ncbi:DUF1287 domain-containing protein [Alkalibacter mobilis]|uniref:DUF1287 domain-containing protein n=1 Tax=Alkalibacter mobilis TaxID=2787712 RepID=UPI00189C8D81|nr:DUF1287 domain-containing protein [Alkalibacter mobilis]MBF7096770.1 DUF1287 domain-containing protein [Alkalibacter mobilis]
MSARKRNKRIKIKKSRLIIIAVIISFSTFFLGNLDILDRGYYRAKDFGIETLKSQNDKNENGIDDYSDIMLGAREDIKNDPEYISTYYEGGYPPDDEGVCTDVIWRAFKNAGYDLKEMVDKDIEENLNEYYRISGKPDPNIDFRRVPNLMVYFQRNTTSLTLDPYEIKEWQPGDIVTFRDTHIGIVSDKRNEEGVAYIIHNGGDPAEEDILTREDTIKTISGHFRFK